jgi:hypothetical protein
VPDHGNAGESHGRLPVISANRVNWASRVSRAPRLGITAAFLLSALAGLSGPSTAAQSLSYSKGQNIAPAYEGWEQHPDGSRYFLFGYMNRNWEEEMDIPIGPDNSFNVGGADRGQPTHFLPRRNRFVFKVPVPADFGPKDELVWTLTAHGKTEKAYATLRPDYVVDDVVKASETGALGAGTSSPEIRGNKPPVVGVEELRSRTVKAGQPVTLVAHVTDDGVPKPRDFARLLAQQARATQGTTSSGSAGVAGGTGLDRNPAMRPPTRITVGKSLGLHVSWFVYRGAGRVTFDPPQIKVWEDTRAGANSPWAPLWVAPALPADGNVPVQVTFEEPGTYVLRCRADDGALVADEELTITVTR